MDNKKRNRLRTLSLFMSPWLLAAWLPSAALAGTNVPSSSSTVGNSPQKAVKLVREAQVSNLGTRSIYINGGLVSKPYAFTANQTTYMPIWYVMQMLKQLGVQSSWDGHVWNLSLPGNVVPDMSNMDGSGGSKSIDVNGTPVEHVDDIAYPDPYSHVLTSYMPIWYLQQALKRIGVNYTWDGANWRMDYKAPTSGLSDNYNVQPLHLAVDYQNILATSGFQHDTEYMELDSLVSALQQFGVPSYVDGNDWYLNASPTPGQSLAATDPTQPLRLYDNQSASTSVQMISYSGKLYFPIWYLQQALQSDHLYTLWDGNALHFSKSNMFQLHDIVNPRQTYTYSQMVSDIQALAATYPDIIHTKVIGQTVYGRDIYAVSIGTGQATALLNGSHHAREWITTNLNMYMLDQYAQAYERNQSIGGYNVRDSLNHTTLWFIPMVNPDGVTLQQFGDSAFPASARPGLVAMNNGSTDFSHWKANAQGIDPNRQYDGGWAGIYIDPVTHAWYEDYKGPAPFYINEVKAVVSLINQVNPQMAVAYHASGGAIYWEYKVSGSRYNVYQNYAKDIQRLTGYSLVYPGSNPSGGGENDWWTYNIGRPGFTIEVGPAEGENQVPVSFFDSIWSQNKAVGLYVANQSYSLYTQHPNDVVHATY